MEEKIVVAQYRFDVNLSTYVHTVHLSKEEYENIFSAGPETWHEYIQSAYRKYRVRNVRFNKLFEYPRK